MASKPKPIIISYHPKSENFRECLVHIIKWYSPDGAELSVESKSKGKTYCKDELHLVSKTSIGIAPRYYKDGKAVNYINLQGKINHHNIERILQMQELLGDADVVEVIKKKFKPHKKMIQPQGGTLYCTLFVNLYKFIILSKPEEKTAIGTETQPQSTKISPGSQQIS